MQRDEPLEVLGAFRDRAEVLGAIDASNVVVIVLEQSDGDLLAAEPVRQPEVAVEAKPLLVFLAPSL
jgi:hypothetical protein